jgi:hypothetical protein
MQDPPTKQQKKKAKDNSTQDEEKKRAFEHGLHNDNDNGEKENVTNLDKTVVNIEEDNNVVNNSGKE